MWFPTNKPRFDGRNQQQNNNTTPAFTGRNTCCNHRFPTGTPHRAGCGARVTAVIAWGKRPVPFRTRKLRPTAPMVLHPGGCGRVGHRRNIIQARPRTRKCPGPDPFKHPTQTPAPQGRRLTAKPQPAAIGHPRTPPQLPERPAEQHIKCQSVGPGTAGAARASGRRVQEVGGRPA